MEGDDPKRRLRALAAGRRVSLSALSAMLGRNPAYLQQFVTRGSPRALAPGDRRRLADFFGIDEAELGGTASRGMFVLPRLDVAASAGPGTWVDGEVMLGAGSLDPVLADRLRLKPGQASIVRVRGDSMEPGLVDGDLIIVDQAQRAPDRRGGLFVLRVDGAVMVKRVRGGPSGMVVTSDNPAAPPVPPGLREVIGRVVWLMRAPA